MTDLSHVNIPSLRSRVSAEVAGAAQDARPARSVVPRIVPRVLLTDPIDASGEELLRARASVRAADETLRMLAGEKPRNLVNPEAWRARRPR